MFKMTTNATDRVIQWWVDYDCESNARRRDRDYKVLCWVMWASFVVSMILRSEAHLKFMSGIAFGIAVAVATVAGLAHNLRRTSATMKVKAAR